MVWGTFFGDEVPQSARLTGSNGKVFPTSGRFGFGFGYGPGSGIGTAFLLIEYYRVLKILIGYFSIKSMIRDFLLVQLRSSQPLDPSRPLVQIYKSFRAILGRCSSRAVEILSNKSKGPLKNYIDYWVYNKH